MKKSTFLFLMCSLNAMSISLIAMDWKAQYSREDLLDARAAWFNQESRIGQLKWEAENIAQKIPVRYFNGERYVASVDATTKTIVTFLGQGKSVTLDYQSFAAFIRDEALFNEAVEQYNQQQYLNIDIT